MRVILAAWCWPESPIDADQSANPSRDRFEYPFPWLGEAQRKRSAVVASEASDGECLLRIPVRYLYHPDPAGVKCIEGFAGMPAMARLRGKQDIAEGGRPTWIRLRIWLRF